MKACCPPPSAIAPLPAWNGDVWKGEERADDASPPLAHALVPLELGQTLGAEALLLAAWSCFRGVRTHWLKVLRAERGVFVRAVSIHPLRRYVGQSS